MGSRWGAYYLMVGIQYLCSLRHRFFPIDSVDLDECSRESISLTVWWWVECFVTRLAHGSPVKWRLLCKRTLNINNILSSLLCQGHGASELVLQHWELFPVPSWSLHHDLNILTSHYILFVLMELLINCKCMGRLFLEGTDSCNTGASQ